MLEIALIGAVLGVFNTWWNFSRDRVRLKVTCDEDEQGNVVLDIVNLSDFPVTITDVGFVLANDDWFALRALDDEGRFESRSGWRGTTKIAELTLPSKPKVPYARTRCKHNKRGSRIIPALRTKLAKRVGVS